MIIFCLSASMLLTVIVLILLYNLYDSFWITTPIEKLWILLWTAACLVNAIIGFSYVIEALSYGA